MRDAAVAPGCGVWVATGWSRMAAVAVIKHQNVFILSWDGPTEEADVDFLKKMWWCRKQTLSSKNGRLGELSLRQAKPSEGFQLTFKWACSAWLLSIANTSVVNLAILHSVPKINKAECVHLINASYLYAKYTCITVI